MDKTKQLVDSKYTYNSKSQKMSLTSFGREASIYSCKMHQPQNMKLFSILSVWKLMVRGAATNHVFLTHMYIRTYSVPKLLHVEIKL